MRNEQNEEIWWPNAREDAVADSPQTAEPSSFPPEQLSPAASEYYPR